MTNLLIASVAKSAENGDTKEKPFSAVVYYDRIVHRGDSKLFLGIATLTLLGCRKSNEALLPEMLLTPRRQEY